MEANSERQAALAALRPYDTAEIGAEVVRLYPILPPDVLPAAQELLVSRKGWARGLLEAVEGGKVKREAVPQEVV
ncbi:MAG: hypothetical protein JO326_09835, partial [Acetobacteraceae bacterium]|nr:hypothetical protein [Acetobacteraceae bacterium]